MSPHWVLLVVCSGSVDFAVAIAGTAADVMSGNSREVRPNISSHEAGGVHTDERHFVDQYAKSAPRMVYLTKDGA